MAGSVDMCPPRGRVQLTSGSPHPGDRVAVVRTTLLH